MAKKQVIRLTESDLHKIIKESVNNILSELDWKTYDSARKKSREKNPWGGRQYDFANAAQKAFERDVVGSPKTYKDGNMTIELSPFSDFYSNKPELRGLRHVKIGDGEFNYGNGRSSGYNPYKIINDITDEEKYLVGRYMANGMSRDDAEQKARNVIDSKYAPNIKRNEEGEIMANYKLKPKSPYNVENEIDSYLENGYKELDDYVNGKYDYQKGKGWVKK
jgi:hypothetical protein